MLTNIAERSVAAVLLVATVMLGYNYLNAKEELTEVTQELTATKFQLEVAVAKANATEQELLQRKLSVESLAELLDKCNNDLVMKQEAYDEIDRIMNTASQEEVVYTPTQDVTPKQIVEGMEFVNKQFQRLQQ